MASHFEKSVLNDTAPSTALGVFLDVFAFLFFFFFFRYLFIFFLLSRNRAC